MISRIQNYIFALSCNKKYIFGFDVKLTPPTITNNQTSMEEELEGSSNRQTSMMEERRRSTNKQMFIKKQLGFGGGTKKEANVARNAHVKT